MLKALLFAALAAQAADLDAPQTLDLRIAVSSAITYSALSVELSRLGEQVTLELVDDGSLPDDVAWDGIYVGRLVGPWSRYAEARVIGRAPSGEEELLFSGLVRTEDRRRVMLGWWVKHLPQGNRAIRTAVAYPDGAAGAVNSAPMLVAFGWGVFLLCYVGWLTQQTSSPGAT